MQLHTGFKPGLHISGKSQTIGDFAVSQSSRILPTYENTSPLSSGMVGYKSGKSGAFLFSQRVPDFCDDRRFSRHMSKIWDGREQQNPPSSWIFLIYENQGCVSQNTRRLFGPERDFEIQSLSFRSKVFSPKTSAKFFVDLRFFRLAFETNEN